MTYHELNAVFLTVAAVVAALAVVRVLIAGAGRRARVAGAAAVTAVVLLALTAIFDNLMIAAGLFSYAPHTLSGLHVGLAPIEDFAYPVAAALVLPGLWVLLGGRRQRP